MRKITMILLGLSMTSALFAQEPEKQKEIGLIFNNLNSFGIGYKTGTAKSLWRFNTLIASGNDLTEKSDSLVETSKNFYFNFKIGKEFRKNITEKLELRCGADLSFGYNQNEFEYDEKKVNYYDRYNKRTTYERGLNLVFGFNYLIGKNIIVGAELMPEFLYTTGESVEKARYRSIEEEFITDISNFNYGLSSNSALISIAYRFQ
jgi:hypothetical protein